MKKTIVEVAKGLFKNDVPVIEEPKRKRGRPKKAVLVVEEPKRKRGRPKKIDASVQKVISKVVVKDEEKTLRRSEASKRAWIKIRAKKTTKAEKEKIQQGSFPNYFGKGKESAREFICKYIQLSNLLTGDILCLPAALCLLELKIREVSNLFRFIACEREENTFNTMVKTAKENGLSMFSRLGDLREAIYEAGKNSFSHVILDYCGLLTTFKQEILYLTSNDIVKVGGVIITSVLKARDKVIINEMNIKKATKNMTLTSRAVKKFFNGIERYELVDTFEYCDSSPMMVVVIKRIK